MPEVPGAARTGAADGREAAVSAKRRWRDFERAGGARPGLKNLTIGVAASFTANTLAPFIGAAMVNSGFAPAFRMGQYNQLFQTCLDHSAQFGGATDVILFLWRLEDIVGPDLNRFAFDPESDAIQSAERTIMDLADAIAGLRARFNGLLVVATPPFPDTTPHDLLDLRAATVGARFHRRLTEAFVNRLSGVRGINILDVDSLQRRFGAARAFDARQWYLFRQPYSDAFLLQLGEVIGRLISAAHKPRRKCIVVDCDNTLWGGVVGEDGLAGIEIGSEFPGSAFRDFQQSLLMLRHQGIFLAIVSKNNEADVWEVFEKHDGMVLKREDFSATRINWRPKSENLAEIARELNIGIDSLVFIDDSPMEIAQVSSAWPEVECILIPDEPADIVSALRYRWLFDQLEITREDRERVNMMQFEQKRESLRQQMTPAEFVKALNLQVDVFEAQPEDLGRITQLINKTNQFNLTTIRRTLDEVQALSASSDSKLYGVRVKDQFGDYGLTGVVIVTKVKDEPAWDIDTFLLSCRVLGRGVETSILATIGANARAEGIQRLYAHFRPTAKNALAARFLPDHNFRRSNDTDWFVSLDELSKAPDQLQPAVPA
ncbi:MAG: HAD-IIIC family phosphatase [Alphaproteobacteria bacterium]